MGASANGGNNRPDLTTWAGMSAFLQAIYGDALQIGVPWTTGFHTSATGENWKGWWGLGHLAGRFPTPTEADLYFAIGLMKPGSDRRSVANVIAQPLLIVDDIGTKVPVEKWEALFALGCPRPTAQIETSPGNQTWIWALDGRADGEERAGELALIRAWIIEQKLSDEVMDAPRYIRLPGGWNSKPKYRGPNGDGPPPLVSLVEWRDPAVVGRVDVDALGAVIVGVASGTGTVGWREAAWPTGAAAQALMNSAQVGSALGAGALARTADAARPDALMRLGVELDMSLTQRGPGVVEALCPNIGMHTTRADTGFAFLGGGLMHCNHASCQGLGTRDFRQMMIDQYDERRAGLVAMGLPVAASDATSGAHFLARETLRDLGGLDDAAEASAVAEVMAEVSEARASAAGAALAVGLDALARRFLWVNPVMAFFDTQDRRVVPGDVIDTHGDVVAVVPVGRSGERRARNVLLNHPDIRRVEGLVRVAGSDEVLVSVKDAQGVVRLMANTWVASGVGRGRTGPGGPPVEWLELLEYVIPDAAYREWFVHWLAWGLQRPHDRRMTIPLIVGGQGIGKDALLGPVVALMGHHNVENVSMARMASAFTEWMLADMVVLPELKLSADGKMYNQIKDWLSNAEAWVSINEKFQRPYTTRVNFSFIAMTNHLDALQGIEPDDRRWQVYLSPAAAADAAYYRRVVGGANTDDALERLHAYLMAVDLSGFTPYTPAPGASKAKREMLADTLKGSAQWAYQMVGEGGRFAARTVLTLGELETAALTDPNRRVSSGVDTYLLRNGLKAAGWVNVGLVRAGQDRHRLWVSPALASSPVMGLLAPKHLGAIYLAERQQIPI